MKLDKSTAKKLVREIRRRAENLFRGEIGGRNYWYTCPEINEAAFKVGMLLPERHVLEKDYNELILDFHSFPFDDLAGEERLNRRALSMLFFANMIESGLYD